MKTLRSFINEAQENFLGQSGTSYDVLMFLAKTIFSEEYGDASMSEILSDKSGFIDYAEEVFESNYDLDDDEQWFYWGKPIKAINSNNADHLPQMVINSASSKKPSGISNMIKFMFDSKKPVLCGIDPNSCHGDVTIAFQIYDDDQKPRYVFALDHIDAMSNLYNTLEGKN